MQQVNDHAPKDVVKVLVANKADLQDDRLVHEREGQALANKYGIPFLEISAKTGQNVNSMFELMGEKLVE
jgi:GTPase SAR1 family protein